MAHEAGDRQPLGQVLVASGLLTQQQVDQAIALGKRRGARLGEVLVTEGLLTQDQINWALAQHFSLSYVDVRLETLDTELVRSLRPGLLYQHKVIPLVRIGDTLTLAMADPTDSDAVLEVSDTTGCDIECAIASAAAIVAALDSVFAPEERRRALAAEPTNDEFAKMAAHPVPRQRLGQILVDSLLVTEQQLEAALSSQKGSAKRLGELLIEQGLLTEDQINWALARHLDVPYIDLTPDMVDPAVVELLPFEFLDAHRLVPMMRVGNQICVAMVDPLDHAALAEVAAASGCNVVVSIAPRRAVESVLARLERGKRGASAPQPPIDLLGADAAAPPEPDAQAEATDLKELSTESIAAFKETMQHSRLPLDEKFKVYDALHTTAQARQRGGRKAEQAARQRAFAALSPASMKLALQLSHQVGSRRVPVLKDEEFQAKHGRVGAFLDNDRRFVVDRRTYDRTVREFAQKHKLDPVQIENAVMAARAYVLTAGEKRILLISDGEKELAKALTKIVRIARTREHPQPAPPAPSRPPEKYSGPERRTAQPTVQESMDAELAASGLDEARCDKVVRAFRLIHKQLHGTYDRTKLKELIRDGIFVGFGSDEIALVERILRIHGYEVS